MKKLTDDPDHLALWLHPLYGARTLDDIQRLRALKLRPTQIGPINNSPCSMEMENRNERLIDEHGACGFSD